MVNGLAYLVTGFATGRFRKKLLPITPSGVLHDVRAALTFKLGHDDLTVYNYVQRLLYAGIIVVGVLIVLSGLSMWKPVQLLLSRDAVRRLSDRALRPFLLHGRDLRLPRHSRLARAAGAEEPARDDHRSLRA